jgi:hypothetical protein
VITRVQMLVKHLKQRKQATIGRHGMGFYEYETLHMLGRCRPDQRVTPKQIAARPHVSPAAITGRLDALERRGSSAGNGRPRTAAGSLSSLLLPGDERGEQRATIKPPSKPGCWHPWPRANASNSPA